MVKHLPKIGFSGLLFTFLVIFISNFVYSSSYLPGNPTLIILEFNKDTSITYPNIIAYYNGEIIGESEPLIQDDIIRYELWLTLPIDSNNVSIDLLSVDGVFNYTIIVSEGDILYLTLSSDLFKTNESSIINTQPTSSSDRTSTQTIGTGGEISNSDLGVSSSNNITVKKEKNKRDPVLSVILKQSYLLGSSELPNNTLNSIMNLLNKYYKNKLQSKQFIAVLEYLNKDLYVEKYEDRYKILLFENISEYDTNHIDNGILIILPYNMKNINVVTSGEVLSKDPLLVLFGRDTENIILELLNYQSELSKASVYKFYVIKNTTESKTILNGSLNNISTINNTPSTTINIPQYLQLAILVVIFILGALLILRL